jgi:hypothetical protein
MVRAFRAAVTGAAAIASEWAARWRDSAQVDERWRSSPAMVAPCAATRSSSEQKAALAPEMEADLKIRSPIGEGCRDTSEVSKDDPGGSQRVQSFGL